MTLPSQPPQIQTTHRLLDNPVFCVEQQDLRLPDGSSYRYHLMACHRDGVLVIPRLADGRLLLERIWRQPLAQTFLEFPGGGVEPGENPVAAAQRELVEETGHAGKTCRWLQALEPLPGLMRLRVHVVLAEQVHPVGPPCREVLEHLELVAMTLQEARQEAARTLASGFLWLGLAALALDLAND